MKTVLITGAGRADGLGFGVAKQLGEQGYHIVVSARKNDQVNDRVAELSALGYTASGLVMDITDDNSVESAADKLSTQLSQLDVLINNAAYFGDFNDVVSTDLTDVQLAFDTNFIGTWRVVKAFYALLKKSSSARVVNVSSGAGSYDDPVYGLLHGSMGMPVSTYALTKLTINGLTIKMAKEFKKDHILVNAVCPDVVNTHPDTQSMGRSVEDGAKSISWAATIPDDGPTGEFFRDGKPLPW
ncbi:hypothetical protein AYR62_05520 [Secundilactobacillus paracollinoides]|uniref:Short-chain dehydrogenase n=1 Tax=Secundilactobacillus paracollinoides TaxID=240427 RepID=A0A1B2J0M6_9LACO|nr:SDR family NAD(P)-dependent oxidoreductase [Secundilactobacillus paracollinoides]ANZ63605.1 hypothetical protein AYR62_05520 [Secundilactobacillus paracollinoides]ANZ67865.1 hypothetical protein AYR63_12430 [Secundilactobacillus paracollinoides]KRL79273.1 hypothetical protein FC17_GL000538 [Secundilactobacillus paracollinoides DSM 15502 = JCM 11969]